MSERPFPITQYVVRSTHYALRAAFVIAVPLVLALGSIHGLLYDPAVYNEGYAKYAIARRTGLSEAELRAATDALIAYFRGAPTIDATIERNGVRQALYNDRELRHMRDVRELFWLGDRVLVLAGLYLAAFVMVGLLTRRLRGRELALLAFAGSALTFALGVAFGLASLVDFETLFIQFHLLSFDNDLWMLDPRRDYLVAMFPEPFWFDCAIRIAATTLGGATVIALLSYLYLRRQPRRVSPVGEAGRSIPLFPR